MQKGRQRGAVGVRKNHRATRSSGGTAVIFPGGVPGKSADFKPSPASPCTPFHGSGKVKAVPSTEARRMSASIGSRVGTLPEILADLTGPVRRIWQTSLGTGLPETSIIAQLGGSLREIRDTWGVSKEAMAGIVPESWLEWGLGAEGDQAPRTPEADMLAGRVGQPGQACCPHSLDLSLIHI